MNEHVKLKQVPQHFKDIIFGYLRKLSCINMYKVPNDVIHIIIFYYYIHFKFYKENCHVNCGKYLIIIIYFFITPNSLILI